MNPLLALFALGVLVIAVSCSSRMELVHANATARLENDPRIGVGGVVSNRVVVAGKPVSCALWITNVTDRPLYVTSHFSSNNCQFGWEWVHGDSWGPTFEDFVLLDPMAVMTFTRGFTLDSVGEGEFEVDFCNNLLPDVRRQLEGTGVPFVTEVRCNLGRIEVRQAPLP
ncbi:MAG: hypothetical protein H7A46_04875 [Verrucomicrobiales bacterium]|nr:hypothetical protein [Verrucomicrobiales bacterium]